MSKKKNDRKQKKSWKAPKVERLKVSLDTAKDTGSSIDSLGGGRTA